MQELLRTMMHLPVSVREYKSQVRSWYLSCDYSNLPPQKKAHKSWSPGSDGRAKHCIPAGAVELDGHDIGACFCHAFWYQQSIFHSKPWDIKGFNLLSVSTDGGAVSGPAGIGNSDVPNTIALPTRDCFELQWLATAAGEQYISLQELDLIIGNPDRAPSKVQVNAEWTERAEGRIYSRSLMSGTIALGFMGERI